MLSGSSSFRARQLHKSGRILYGIIQEWIEYEFPDADIYFLSHSTMTKFYRGHKERNSIIELFTDIIQKIQRNRGIDNNIMAATATDAVFYTNNSTVIYSSPDLSGKVLFSGLETGLPIHVTGITNNGFFRIDMGEMTAYIHGEGLNDHLP